MAACPELVQSIWQSHLPVGVVIALLGVLGVVVPWVRGDALQRKEKAFWTLIMFALVGLEVDAIYLDRAQHDQEQFLARCRQMESFKGIATSINSAISQSQRQFEITIANLNSALKTEQETLKNTRPKAILSVRALSPVDHPQFFAAGRSLSFNVFYKNSGNDVASDVRHYAKIYVRRLDNSEDQKEINADFEAGWKKILSLDPQSFDPSANPFFTFTSDPLSRLESDSLADRSRTIYWLVRLAWRDNTGVWRSDLCAGLQNPMRNIAVTHPCEIGNKSRYPDRIR